MADTERSKAELLSIFADGQPAGSINPQDMRDYVVTADVVNTRFSTGLITGGIVTINAGDPTAVDISAGEGFYADNFTDPQNPVRLKVSWSTFLAQPVLNLTTELFTNFGLDLSSGTAVVVIQNPIFSASQRRDFIPLSLAGHTTGVAIQSLSPFYAWALDGQQALYDMREVLGQINVAEGNVYSGNSNLTINKSSGGSFFLGGNYHNSKKTPNMTNDLAQAPVPLVFYTYQDGVGGFIAVPPSPNIDPNFWDDGTGTLNTVANNQFTIQRLYWFPEALITVVHYGQTEYANLAAALAAINTEPFIKNPQLPPAASGFRSWLVVEEGTTDLSNPVNAAFLAAGKFGDILRT